MNAEANDNVSKRTLILAMIATAIGTVLVLHWQGLLRHSEHKEDFALSTYRAVLIAEQKEESYRLSHKPSHQSAQCINGYLFIVADKNDAMQGLLVDYKNRGIKCALPAPNNQQSVAQP
ncbi:MAG: hypothetical protein R3183_00815 [Oleiphilaceae bacterium]|nr:hypothetical protein [Oleiphilaceae bacterium]